MASLGAPVRVSPLIKTFRWGGLVAGIIYGTVHFNSLSKKETILREEEAKLAAVRSVQLAAAKEKASKAEMDALAVQAGATPKA
ncbi:UNVERIFIED_CONTAM: hypothetical protein GTU68_003866 [Idotea baltica]|nr:hypothetical protein [Idotea baltica]